MHGRLVYLIFLLITYTVWTKAFPFSHVVYCMFLSNVAYLHLFCFETTVRQN